MKRTLLSRLILASLAGVAVSGVQAGQIQASSVSIAREVITLDTQSVGAPAIAYRFAGDVDARAQAQTFQVQFTLGAGSWDGWVSAGVAPAAVNGAPENQAFSITDGVSGVIVNQEAVPRAGVTSYAVTSKGISADGKTLFVTFTVHQDGVALIKQPLISVNVASNTLATVVTPVNSTDRGFLQGMKTVAGDLAADFAANQTCVATKTLPVSVKHYVALTNPAILATDANATPDEHTRGSATNSATLVVFPTNLKVNFATSTAGATLTPGGNLSFTGTGAVVASASPATPGTSHVAVGAGNLVRLGIMNLTQNATGYDSDLTNQYLLSGVAGGANANGLDAVATAAANVGDVEVSSVNAVITATNGFVVGGTVFFAAAAANCGAVLAGTAATAITAANAAGPLTITIPTAAVNAAFGAAGTNAVEICYSGTGAATIPSSAFTAVGTVVKAAAGANVNEQNNACNGTLFSLGGGIKIDVRNYASNQETSGYKSILRIINNSDVATADVWAQIIHQDGKLGNYGLIIPALAPRAVKNMSAAQIEALLTTPPAATVAANNGAAQAAVSADGAPRIRITSNSGRSLRVQNYLFNSVTNQLLEGSSSQAVDFEGTASRAPVNEGQYQEQDANSGLNLR
ncbi:MAG: hypothetical protein KF686_09200 [Ramlibacter sp.]|nr:hypothetical protein [Ramlibacter sp.]